MIVRETFFRPEPIASRDWALSADLYNRALLLRSKSKDGCLFVPIRSMQFQAIIDREEILFVDGQGGYRVIDGQGGRMVDMSWTAFHPQTRNDLTDPVPCRVEFYREEAVKLLNRVVSEFDTALDLASQRKAPSCPPGGAAIVRLKRD
ncbi:MAG: hypothetical protein KDH88_11565 [Chromatiales bacterium]|nr:hypothetical protein [Chromatiales bacterium]